MICHNLILVSRPDTTDQRKLTACKTIYKQHAKVSYVAAYEYAMFSNLRVDYYFNFYTILLSCGTILLAICEREAYWFFEEEVPFIW